LHVSDVAPPMGNVPERDVYLPPGNWIDYQSDKAYEGARYHHIRAGEIPIVLLVRKGAAIPRVRLAQSTAWIDWQEMELVVFCGEETTVAEGTVCLPEEGELHALRLEREGEEFVLKEDPLQGRVQWKIHTPA
jgi:alpha-D-xyloside xylohydrolase